MPNKRRPIDPTPADTVLDAPQETVLDLLDHLLNKGALLNGDVMLGVAGVDLVYLRLSALLCAADRLLSPMPEVPAPRPGRKSRARVVRKNR